MNTRSSPRPPAAPFARLANPGSQVASGTRVLVLGSAARGVVFRAGVADRDVVQIRTGNPAIVSFDALPERSFHGVVRQVGADADPRTGTYTIEVALDGAADLPSGLVGHTRIQAFGATSRLPADVSAIPADALVEGHDANGVVFVMDGANRIALKRAVSLVGVDGNRVLVRGLSGATRVVTSGAAWLKDSSRVEGAAMNAFTEFSSSATSSPS